MSDWMASARCVTEDPGLFFPEDDRETERLAIRACNACPVVALCRDQFKDEPYGVVGGTTRRERKRDRTLCGTPEGHLRHQKFFATSCAPCRDAWNAQMGNVTPSGVENRSHISALAGKGYNQERIAQALGLSLRQVQRMWPEVAVA